MKFTAFYLFYAFVRILALFPTKWLYFFSSMSFPLIYFIVPYRKNLVLKNLKNSFPDKSGQEIRSISKKFYRHFCDSFFESMVAGFIPEKEILQRYRFKNPEICIALFERKKSISLLMSHYGNWEWSASLSKHVPHKVLPIYKPLENKYFDDYVRGNRERFGAETVALEKILRTLIKFEAESIPTITFFLADQRPLMAKIQYWTTFLNQDTPVVMGPEKIARHFNHAVLFLKVIPVKRGYYEIEFIELAEDTKNLAEYQIIERYHQELEKMIRERPEYWLWTHDRWKHKLEDYEKLQKKRKGK